MVLTILKRAEISNLNDAEKKHGIDQAAEHQSNNILPVSGFDTTKDQVSFTEKTAGRRHADHGEGAQGEDGHGDRHASKNPLQ